MSRGPRARAAAPRGVWLAGLATLLLAPASGRAADKANTRRFAPSPVLSPYLTLDGSHTHGQGGLALSLIGSMERRPLIFYKDGARTADIIGRRIAVDFAAAYGLLDWLDIGLAAPLVADQEGRQTDSDRSLTRFAFGDPGLALKAELLDKQRVGFGLAAIAGVTLPLGDAAAFAGEPNATAAGRLAAELPLGSRVDLGLNAGYRVRENTGIDQALIGDELLGGLGASVRLTPAVALVGEANLSARAAAPFESDDETPLDGNGGVRVSVWEDLRLLAGGGAGLRPGYGSPAWRAFVGVEIVPRRHDFDGDRIADGRDNCVEQPGVPENDGCPPLPAAVATAAGPPADDQDADGVLDALDRCPYLPEDRDSFRDDDGCPDPDNDLDFIADVYDADPLGAEDWDGFEDKDGIPDLDNDRDGIADYVDACPNEPGGADGCPGSAPAVAAQGGPPNAGGAPQGALMLGDLIHPERPIGFELARAELTEDGRAVVADLARFISAHPDLGRVEVGVHVDSMGSRRWKIGLSRRRAHSVTAALVAGGVARARLVPRGYGPAVPVATNRTKAGRRENRRVELRALGAGGGGVGRAHGRSPRERLPPPRRRWHGADAVVLRPPEPILFEVKRPELTPGARPQIETLAAALREHPEYTRVEVGVHTDGLGSPSWKRRLSRRRAATVRQALIAAGIEGARLATRGYGASRRLRDDSSRANRFVNRRVELTVLEIDGRQSALTPEREGQR